MSSQRRTTRKALLTLMTSLSLLTFARDAQAQVRGELVLFDPNTNVAEDRADAVWVTFERALESHGFTVRHGRRCEDVDCARQALQLQGLERGVQLTVWAAHENAPPEVYAVILERAGGHTTFRRDLDRAWAPALLQGLAGEMVTQIVRSLDGFTAEVVVRDGPVGAEVRVDGDLVGVVPARVERPAGPIRVEVRDGEGGALVRDVIVPESGTLDVRFEGERERPVAPREPDRGGAWRGVAYGFAGLGAGALVGAVVASQNTRCGTRDALGRCFDREIRRPAAVWGLSAVAGAAAVATVTAVTVGLVGRRAPTEPDVSVELTAGGLRLRGSF